MSRDPLLQRLVTLTSVKLANLFMQLGIRLASTLGHSWRDVPLGTRDFSADSALALPPGSARRFVPPPTRTRWHRAPQTSALIEA